MNDKLTIYTPINSDYGNLDIVYESLKRQTNTEFTWYILDYNVLAYARDSILKFKQEDKLKIQYHHQFFKGRYLATQFAFEDIKTKYILGLDGGYFMVNDGVQILLDQWQRIENGKEDTIVEIRGLAKDSTNALVGSSTYSYEKGIDYVDITWHEMVLKRGNFYEMLASWDRIKFLECVHIKDYTLFSDEVDELSNTLLWASLGRKYQSRYLNTVLKCKIDFIRSEENNINLYNRFVSNFYFLTENLNYFFHSPKYFSGVMYSFIHTALKLNIKLKDLLKLNKNTSYRFILASYYLPVRLIKNYKK